MQVALSQSELPDFLRATLKQLVNDADTASPLAIALSGGSDSRALALLLKDWAGGRPLHALIVDHGLRNDSATEAADTANWAARHGMQSEILALALPREAAGLQQRARAARYEALIAACQRLGARFLFFAQHADDQIETVLFRLLRGSGLHGLAGMSAKREQQDVLIIRPLLAIPKKPLKAYLAQRGEAWIEDPSNHNADFARVRLREWLSQHSTQTQRQRLWQFAAACGRFRRDDEILLNQKINKLCSLNASGFASIHPALFEESAEIAQWMLRRLLISVNGSIAMPRQHEVVQLYNALLHAPDKARSLHHCLIFMHQGRFLACREPARGAPPVAIAAGDHLRFDHRFDVAASPSLPEGCRLGMLSDAGFQQIKEHVTVPRRIALTLPTLWHLEAPVLVPHIGYCASPAYKDAIELCFSPAKRLADTPFFLMNEAQE